jgi:outer membrane receptor protein involved in Fe transport
LNVQNVMDKDPPVVGGAPGGFSYEQPSTNDGLYDVMGRTFRVGLRFRM